MTDSTIQPSSPSAADLEAALRDLWERVPAQPPRMTWVAVADEEPPPDGTTMTDGDGVRWEFGRWLPAMDMPPLRWLTIATEVRGE